MPDPHTPWITASTTQTPRAWVEVNESELQCVSDRWCHMSCREAMAPLLMWLTLRMCIWIYKREWSNSDLTQCFRKALRKWKCFKDVAWLKWSIQLWKDTRPLYSPTGKLDLEKPTPWWVRKVSSQVMLGLLIKTMDSFYKVADTCGNKWLKEQRNFTLKPVFSRFTTNNFVISSTQKVESSTLVGIAKTVSS